MTTSGSGGFFPYGSVSVSAATKGVLIFDFEPVCGLGVLTVFTPKVGLVNVDRTEVGTDSQSNLLSGGP